MSSRSAYPRRQPTSPSSSLLPLPPLPEPLDSADGEHARFVDAAAAAAAAAEILNKHNARANPAINLYSSTSLSTPVITTPRLAIASTETSTETSTEPSIGSAPRLAGSHIQFQSQTIAPSPPPPSEAHQDPVDSKSADAPHQPQPGTSHLQLELQPAALTASELLNGFATPSRARPSLTLHHKTSASSLRPISRTPSLKTGSLSGVFGTASAASSTYPSPVISAMGDVTPLPSPLLSCDSPGPWKKLARRGSREGYLAKQPSIDSPPATSPIDAMASTPTKRKTYGGLGLGLGEEEGGHGPPRSSHTRNRSISEYTPDPMLIPKRMVTVSGSHAKAALKDIKVGFDGHMRREPHLSEARGLTPIEKPPTPPPSESSLSVNDSSSVNGSGSSVRSSSKSSRHEYFEAYGRHDGKRRRWRAVKMLGQGTFSRVMLATSQASSSASDDEEYPATVSGVRTPDPQPRYERRTLVAVKICEHGPRGGASEDRIEMSLKRELEIMQCIHHPSLVHLKAWSIEPTRAILVLSYCPGGDLFDVASQHREVLSPELLRRIFAELVGAVRYLHGQRIVHRDIKLESELPSFSLSPRASIRYSSFFVFVHMEKARSDLFI